MYEKRDKYRMSHINDANKYRMSHPSEADKYRSYHVGEGDARYKHNFNMMSYRGKLSNFLLKLKNFKPCNRNNFLDGIFKNA